MQNSASATLNGKRTGCVKGIDQLLLGEKLKGQGRRQGNWWLLVLYVVRCE